MERFGFWVTTQMRRLPSFFRAGGLMILAVGILALSVPTLMLSSASSLATAQSETTNATPGFSTPEDAVRHFCQALAANEFDVAIEACAVREQAVGFDFAGWVDRMKTNMPQQNLAPSTSDIYRDLNYAAALGGLAGQMKMLIYSFFVADGMDGRPVMPADRAYAEAFMVAVDAQKLANLKLLRVDPPLKSILESDKNKENFTKMAKLYGAEEMTERIALYELDGQTFMGGFGLYRYASGWKICRLYSSLAGQPVAGSAMAATMRQYVGMLE